MSLSSLLGNPNPLLDKVFVALDQDNIDVTGFELDHICYRVETNTRYLELKNELQKYGTLLSEAQINGRPIATFKLNEPIVYKQREITCFELPAPKPSANTKEGYEHVEFVIDESFDDFMRRYPNIRFTVPEKPKKVNPEIAVKYNGFQVKFHHHPLEYVVKYLQ